MTNPEAVSQAVQRTLDQLPVDDIQQSLAHLRTGIELSAYIAEGSSHDISPLLATYSVGETVITAIATAVKELTAFRIEIGGEEDSLQSAHQHASTMSASGHKTYTGPLDFFSTGDRGRRDTTPDRIYAMFGDVVWARAADDIIMCEAEKMANARRKPFGAYEDRQRPLKDIVHDSYRDMRDAFLASPRMVEFRARATEAYERYSVMQQRGYTSADIHFYRRAEELCEAVRRYAERYFDVGVTLSHMVDARTMTPTDVVSLINDAVAEPGLAGGGGARHFRSFLFQQHAGVPHSVDALHVEAADGHIEEVTFDSFIDVSSPEVGSWELLAGAVKYGAELTPAQRQVLVYKGLLKPGLLKRRNTLSAEADKIAREVASSPILDDLGYADRTDIVTLFVATLPPDLAEKIQGRSRLWYGRNKSPATVGPVEIHIREHDYDHYQRVVRLDTRGWSPKDINRLLERYIRFVQAFPRVPEPEHHGYKRFQAAKRHQWRAEQQSK